MVFNMHRLANSQQLLNTLIFRVRLFFFFITIPTFKINLLIIYCKAKRFTLKKSVTSAHEIANS